MIDEKDKYKELAKKVWCNTKIAEAFWKSILRLSDLTQEEWDNRPKGLTCPFCGQDT